MAMFLRKRLIMCILALGLPIILISFESNPFHIFQVQVDLGNFWILFSFIIVTISVIIFRLCLWILHQRLEPFLFGWLFNLLLRTVLICTRFGNEATLWMFWPWLKNVINGRERNIVIYKPGGAHTIFDLALFYCIWNHYTSAHLVDCFYFILSDRKRRHLFSILWSWPIEVLLNGRYCFRQDLCLSRRFIR